MASSSSRNRSIRLWTCCKCREAGISMTLGDCPNCQEARCIDCDVKSHVVTDAEIENEKMKLTRVAGQTGMRASSSGNDRPVSTNAMDFMRRTPELVAQPLRRSHPEQKVLIKLLPSDYREPIYVLREQEDSLLISAWHETLPELSMRCSQAFEKLVSIHLFRMGTTESQSIPTVIVNTSEELGVDYVAHIQRVISEPTSTLFPRAFTVILQLLVKQSHLRRSGGSISPTSSPICEPRNRNFHPSPGTGDSIGIKGSFEDTATIGCYLLVDEKPMVLTVDHLVPRSIPQPSITHTSEQDRHCFLMARLNAEVQRILELDLPHQCIFCLEFRNARRENLQYSMKIISSLQSQSCVFHEPLMKLWLSDEYPQYEIRPLGDFAFKSGANPRDVNGISREMDWALFELRLDGGCFPYLDEDRVGQLSLALSIKPAAMVKSKGRTSGYQLGQVSSTLGTVFHQGYITIEWSVLRSPDTPLDDWIEGGIGVEGDSGGLIVDNATNEIYGMLWGRIGDEYDTVTLFTPLREIFDDIEERTGSHVQLLRGQVMNQFDTVLSAPITLSGYIKRHIGVADQEEHGSTSDPHEQTALSQALSSLSVGRASSPTSERRLPHERYRGQQYRGQGDGREVPRSFLTRPEEDTDKPQWPGSHTYFRYALGDDEE
ncbi:hypothetical protein BKA65DRAFT_234245 [Rhexocercosporidium sp. MPI-PUGE-AT-0058]|nr:hypothetical protein BKA65DRAFT_234245 [Rhexocercosporidium sp. MPI-PUGE-AT-0058]